MDVIFNIKCKPGSVDDINLFDLKKRFTYAVFANTLLTDKGKSLVSQREKDYNTHAIHKELLARMSTSTKSRLESSKILTYISTSKFISGTWNGSSQSFILHWKN